MKISRFAALGGTAAVVVALALSASALGARTSVTVRVEGVKRTLLPSTIAHAESGSITKDGTPAGACPGSSAAGYFDSATHHRWNGTYSSGLGIAIINVLGETHKFTSPAYWSVWVNNRFATTGLCDLKLKPGDQLLLAPAPVKGSTHPIILTAPAHAKVGTPFAVKASYFKKAKGAATPLAHVKVTDAGAVTDRHGSARVTATKAGKLTLVASLRGYIRTEATVTVTR
jgi:hypothetical protein